MNLRVFLIVVACACALVATILGFGWGWFGLDDGRDIPGWISFALFWFFAAHIAPPGRN